MAEVLVERGAKMDVRNNLGWTPLHMASQKGHLKVVDQLLMRGADMNTTEADGETALHLAAYYGHAGVTEALLKNDACPRIQNKARKTPSDLAEREGHKVIEQLLRPTVTYFGPVRSETAGRESITRSTSEMAKSDS